MTEDEKWVYDWLEDHHFAFERLDHEAITSVRDTQILLPGQQVKNLVLKNKKGKQFYFVVLHDEKVLDIKSLAEKLEEKRLSFASEGDLLELLHCPPGTVTLFGLKYDRDQKLQVILDQAVDQKLTMGFHPFVNTTTLNISFEAFRCFLDEFNHPLKVVAL